MMLFSVFCKANAPVFHIAKLFVYSIICTNMLHLYSVDCSFLSYTCLYASLGCITQMLPFFKANTPTFFASFEIDFLLLLFKH